MEKTMYGISSSRHTSAMLEQIPDIFHFGQKIRPAPVRQESNSEYCVVTLYLTGIYDIPSSVMCRYQLKFITFQSVQLCY
ncbi:hypothetical protein [Paenibacillus humicus]|uniref:hypothetical protein n=1 Tax=Paenibacillus humicus TaxID=412861 RepID=UPI003D2BEDC6